MSKLHATHLEHLAYRMFARNTADYADPALTELAWADREIRGFWLAQAQAVVADMCALADGDATNPEGVPTTATT